MGCAILPPCCPHAQDGTARVWPLCHPGYHHPHPRCERLRQREPRPGPPAQGPHRPVAQRPGPAGDCQVGAGDLALACLQPMVTCLPQLTASDPPTCVCIVCSPASTMAPSDADAVVAAALQAAAAVRPRCARQLRARMAAWLVERAPKPQQQARAAITVAAVELAAHAESPALPTATATCAPPLASLAGWALGLLRGYDPILAAQAEAVVALAVIAVQVAMTKAWVSNA